MARKKAATTPGNPAGDSEAAPSSKASQVQQMIDRDFPPETLSRALKELLEATKAPAARTGGKEKEVPLAPIPDWSARIRAIELILEYQLGKPLAKEPAATASAPTMKAGEFSGLIQNTPALAEALKLLAQKVH